MLLTELLVFPLIFVSFLPFSFPIPLVLFHLLILALRYSERWLLSQVSGRKRVTLLPPSAHPCVYLFPSLHPRARKSQVPVYARGPLTSSSCSCSRASDSQRTPINAGAGADSLRQECCSNNNGKINGKINGNACSYDRRGRNFAPHFLSFVQNGTWFGPNQNPTPLERQFPKFVHYLRTGTCDLPAGGFSQNASSHPIERSTFASSFAARGRQRPWIVVLEPGDALYIPPLWLHSVETLEASISVNTFAPSIEVSHAVIQTKIHSACGSRITIRLHSLWYFDVLVLS